MFLLVEALPIALYNFRCSLKEGDVLVFATSSDLQQNRQEFTGTSGANWTSFQIPGQPLLGSHVVYSKCMSVHVKESHSAKI